MRLGPPSQLGHTCTHTQIHTDRTVQGSTSKNARALDLLTLAPIPWAKGHTPAICSKQQQQETRFLQLLVLNTLPGSRDGQNKRCKSGPVPWRSEHRQEGGWNVGWVNPTDKSNDWFLGWSFILLSQKDDQRRGSSASFASAATSLSLSLSCSLSCFLTLPFSPSLARLIWREGGGGKEERRRAERIPSRQQLSQRVRKCVCVCVSAHARVVELELTEIEESRGKMRGKRWLVLMLRLRRRALSAIWSQGDSWLDSHADSERPTTIKGVSVHK